MRTPRLRDLSAAERRLWLAFTDGRALNLTSGPDDGPQNGPSWGPARRIRAEVITALLARRASTGPAGPSGLRLAGARITGRLNLAHTTIEHPLEFERCLFDEGLDLSEATTRSVRLSGCFLRYLDADRISLRGELEATGCRMDWISLYAARATEIEISGTRLSRPGDTALNGDLMVVEAAVYCHDMHITGRVRLPGAHIVGYLELDGSKLSYPGGLALFAPGLVVDSGLLARRGNTSEHRPFTVQGETHLAGARISGGLRLDDACLLNPGAAALRADQISVEGGLFMPGATVEGELRLRTARVSGPLSLTESRPGPARIDGVLDLRQAHVSVLQDSADAWPSRLRLEGFTYDELTPQLTARERLQWLSRMTDRYQPQPYEQLAACYRAAGRDEEARRVLLVAQRRRRQTLNPAARAWGLLLDAVVGYGYRPWLAGLWLLGLLAAGSLYFGAHRPPPLNPQGTPHFNAVAYTLNLLLPVINLGQSPAWNPSGTAQFVAYGLIISGWVLATALVAGVARVLNRT